MFRLSQRTILSTLIGLSMTALATTAAADPVAEPNVIQGHVRFTNTHPIAVALLDQIGMGGVSVGASSVPPAYSSYTYSTLGTPRDKTYELWTESAALGAGGIQYDVAPNGGVFLSGSSSLLPGFHSAWYYFQPQPSILLQAPAQQPNGVTVDFDECVGLVHIRWCMDATCATPYYVVSGGINTSNGTSSFSGTTETYVFVLDGTTETTFAHFLGSQPGTPGTFVFQVPLNLHPTTCTTPVNDDPIQHIDIDMSQYWYTNLATVNGPFDIDGETESGNIGVYLGGGPLGNYKSETFPATPPVTWWSIPYVVPGNTYTAMGSATIRSGRMSNDVRSAIGDAVTGPVVVPPSGTTDLQLNIGGMNRYPFVMHPGRVYGDILLADPYVAQHPGATSLLSSLWFAADQPSFPRQEGTVLQAIERDTNSGWSTSSFPGAFDVVTGALSSSYELVLPNAYDLTRNWEQTGIQLAFEAPNGQYDNLSISPTLSTYPIGPGSGQKLDHAYCFSEIVMNYATTSGTLYKPAAVAATWSEGLDFQGNPTEYTAVGQFTGTPDNVSLAQSTGQVRIIVPAGKQVIQNSAVLVAPSGAESTAIFEMTHLKAGCGQRIEAFTGFAVSASLDACAPSAMPELVGTVASSGNTIDRIWYKINGGPDIDICTSNCNPSFNTTLTLAACSNTVEVFASSAGQTASVLTTTTWEDPNDGIDCDGSCEPPPPPTSTCATVNVEPLACVGGAGGYALSLDITNDTNQPIAYVLLTDPHVAPNVITLPSPLQPGDSTTVSVTVNGVNPGASLCLNVGMTNESHEECCSQNVCFDIPACCFGIENEKATCIPGKPGGEFTYAFDFQNRTLDVIEHVFLFSPSGITVSPDYVDVPSTPPNGMAHVGPIDISGATPGEELCLTVGIHDEEMNQCCADEVCFVVPPPCGINPPPPKFRAEESASESCSISAAGSTSGSGLGIGLGLAVLGCLGRRRRK